MYDSHILLYYVELNNNIDFSYIAGNGYITTEVLREILQELDNNLTCDDLDQIIEEVDADGSGTVDFEGELYFFIEVLILFNSQKQARKLSFTTFTYF